MFDGQLSFHHIHRYILIIHCKQHNTHLAKGNTSIIQGVTNDIGLHQANMHGLIHSRFDYPILEELFTDTEANRH